MTVNLSSFRPGTVSAGTMRPEDLIPAFLSALDSAIERATFEDGADAVDHGAAIGVLQDRLAEIERHLDLASDYFESEAATEDLDWLFETLDELAPAGYRFGSLEGDGCDYGYWETDEEAGDE